jgi:hypothetical protein
MSDSPGLSIALFFGPLIIENMEEPSHVQLLTSDG